MGLGYRLGRWALAACAILSGTLAPAVPRLAAEAAGAATNKLFLPLVMSGEPDVDPTGLFLGVNGSPIDGLDVDLPVDGYLAHNPALRAKSFFWTERGGAHWFRNYGSDGRVYSWRFVEPADNEFHWSVWDTLVQEAQKKNIALLASIGNSVPQWANNSTNWRDPPSDLFTNPMQNTAWYNYVYTFVERYDGDGVNDMPGLTRPIKYWEMWNEPDLRRGWEPGNPAHQFNGDVNQYVRLSQVGYAAVKAADPSATVVGPGTAQGAGNSLLCWNSATALGAQNDVTIPPEPLVGPALAEPKSASSYDCWFLWNWQDWINAGGLNYVDVVSFVRYMNDIDHWDWYVDHSYIDGFLDLVDASRGGKQVWLLETGWPGSPTGQSSIDKARNLPRITVIFWNRSFMDRLFWYDGNEAEIAGDPNAANRGYFQTLTDSPSRGKEPDPYFHPVHKASEVMTLVLRDFVASDRPVAVTINSQVRVYKFTGHGRQVWVYWSRDGVDHTVSINTGGQTTQMIGLFGEDLGTFAGGNVTAGPRPTYLTTDLVWNQNLGRITGRVSDGDFPNDPANALANVTVSITGPVNASTVTDADGNYVFEDLPDGYYTVSLPGLSTTPASRMVTVNREQPWGRTSFSVN